jgi:CRISPR-associated DxTHG motif protein
MGFIGAEQKMKVISFLGIANYVLTKYKYGEVEYETRFFPAAVSQFIETDHLLICCTPTVHEHANLKELRNELDRLGVNHSLVDIPDGHSEADLWQIFDRITAVVEEGETVAFDVTHSYRSLPFLAFLAVAYLKTAKKVQVEKVLYGAYEARDQASNCSPVFDLTPFVSLLDWITATSRFLETGDGYYLARLLEEGMPSGLERGQDLEARALGRDLKGAAEAINSVSLALRVTRPIETMKSASTLAETLNRAKPNVVRKAPPFALLVDKIAGEYGQYSNKDPIQIDLLDGLKKQFLMIDWYCKRRNVVQATILAREWVVSVLAFHFGVSILKYKNGREEVELALNNAVESRKKKANIRRQSSFDKFYQNLTDAERITRLWNSLTNLRNDIAHVGMREGAKPAFKLKGEIQKLLPELKHIKEQFLEEQFLTEKATAKEGKG